MLSYTDEGVPLEVGGRFGTYLRSYTTDDQRVGVHLFRTPTNRLTAFVTKAPTVAVSRWLRPTRLFARPSRRVPCTLRSRPSE